MRKIIYAFCAFGIMAITSCSSDDNSNPDDPIIESPAKKVEGKWKFVTGIVIFQGQTITEDLKSEECDYDFLNFKANGTKDEIYHNTDDNCSQENFTGTWVYNLENDIITTIDNGDNYETIFEVVEISNSTMKLKLISDGGEIIPDTVEVYTLLEK